MTINDAMGPNLTEELASVASVALVAVGLSLEFHHHLKHFYSYSTPQAMTGKTDANFMVTRNVWRELSPLLRTYNIPKMCP